jgi:threonine dehydrogenase-like Zn-dependent dehydrogenase
VQGVREGDRVASISFHAYAEYDFARANTVVKLGAENAQYPFPGEPLGCAANAMARSDVRPGHSVAVVGAGFLGCLLGGMCASSGAKVFAVSRRQFALDTAVRMGASETFLLADGKQVIDRVFELTGGRGCDRVIEAAGAQETLDLAGGLTCIRGRLIIAGYHQEGSRSVDMQMWNWRGIDVINAHERDELMYAEGIRRAVSLIGAGLLDPRILFTHSFSLENLAGAFRAMKERPAGFMKALIYPEDPAPSGGGH